MKRPSIWMKRGRGERFAGGQTRLDEMPLHPAAAAVGDFVLGKRRQEAGGRPQWSASSPRDRQPNVMRALSRKAPSSVSLSTKTISSYSPFSSTVLSTTTHFPLNGLRGIGHVP